MESQQINKIIVNRSAAIISRNSAFTDFRLKLASKASRNDVTDAYVGYVMKTLAVLHHVGLHTICGSTT